MGNKPLTDRGCLGMPSVFNRISKACQECCAREQCRELGLASLLRARERIDVEELIQELRRGFATSLPLGELTEQQQQRIQDAPAKLQTRLRTLLEKGFEQTARECFAQGENPFKTVKNLHVAGELLLAGGFDRTQLREELMARYGWALSNAYSEVSNAIALLRGLALVVERDGCFTLAPSP
jgi:hypothetical protein